MRHLTSQTEFEQLIGRSGEPLPPGVELPPFTIVYFTARWCGPCQRLDKKSIVRATPGVSWYAVDVDENDTTLGYCSCRSIPAFVVIKDGLFVDKKEGASSAQDVLDWLRSKGVPIHQ